MGCAQIRLGEERDSDHRAELGLSIVDVTGIGTFWHLVRAMDTGGASGSASPSQVTVSGASKPGKSKR